MVQRALKCPKKTISSRKWCRRNDSSAVSSLLRAYDYTEPPSVEAGNDSDDDHTPRNRVIFSDGLRHGSHTVSKTYCPDCYCKSLVFRRSSPAFVCCCRQSEKNVTAPSICDLKAPPSIATANRFTQRRDRYERTARDYFKTLRKSPNDLDAELERERDSIERNRDEYKLMSDNAHKCSCARCASDARTAAIVAPGAGSKRIKDLMAFRKEHFLDCHSSAALLRSQCDDECVHVSYMNSEFKWNPLNTDAFGTSRCAKCWHTMSAPTFDSPSVLEALEELPRGEDEEEPCDKMILTTHDNERLEVTLPPNFLREAEQPISVIKTKKKYDNFKIPIPSNSMALRYQKGIVNKAFITEKQFRK